MHVIRNIVAFLGVLALIVISYPMVLVAVGSAFVDGGTFRTYAGWFSWPPIIFALAPLLVFSIAGALLAWLAASRHVLWWAALLGAAYGAIRLLFSSQSIADARAPLQIMSVGVELIVPVVAACVGAYLFRRFATRRPTDAKAA